MWIDVGVGVIVLGFALAGLWSGFWAGVWRLVALVSLYFLAPPVAREIEPTVSLYSFAQGLSEDAQQGLSLIIAAVGLYVIMSVVIAIAGLILRRGRRRSSANRVPGFVLGMLKGTTLSYLLLCAFVLVSASDMAEMTQGAAARIETQAQASHLVGVVREANVLEAMGYDVPTFEEIRDFLEEGRREAVDTNQSAGPGNAQTVTVPPGQPTTPNPHTGQAATGAPALPGQPGQPGQPTPAVVPGAVPPIMNPPQPGVPNPYVTPPGGGGGK